MNPPGVPAGLLTASDVSSALGIPSSSTVYVMAREGLIPSVRFGRYVRFEPDVIGGFNGRPPTLPPAPKGLVLSSLPLIARVLYALRDIAPAGAIAGMRAKDLWNVVFPDRVALPGELHAEIDWPLRDLQNLYLADNDIGEDGGEPPLNARGRRVRAFWRATELGMVSEAPQGYSLLAAVRATPTRGGAPVPPGKP